MFKSILLSSLFFFIFITKVSAQVNNCGINNIAVNASCVTTNYNVSTAFTNSGVAAPTCIGTVYRDGWFTFTATSTNTTITVTNTVANMAFALYTGACGSLVEQGCVDNQGGGASTETGTFTTAIGTAYTIRIMRVNNTGTNNMTGTICVFNAPLPSLGDDCSTALDLAGLTSPYSGTTVGMNNDFSFCSMGSAPDQIFYYDLPNGSTLTINQTVNNYDSRHSLRYSGACPGTIEIVCTDDSDTQVETWQNCTGSTQRVYWIQSGFSTGSGTYTLAWSVTAGVCPPPPCIGSPTAPTNGQSSVSLTPTLSWPASAGATGYDVYFGTTNPPTTLVSANQAGTTYVPGGLLGSTTYYWRIEPINSAGTATGCSNWSFTTVFPAPANDFCGTAEAIISTCGTTFTATGSTSSATATGNGPLCVTGASTANSVWYTFNGTGNNVTASLCGSTYDTKIFVYSGSCGVLTCVSGNDDFCGGQSEVTFATTYGTTYYIMVAGYLSNSGNFTLNVTFTGAPLAGVNAGSDVTICEGQSTNLSGLPNPTAPNPPTNNFTGQFAVGNWTTTLDNSDGFVSTAGAPNSIYMESGDNGSFFEGFTNFSIVIPEDGVISFDWLYHSNDVDFSPIYDQAMYAINGSYVILNGFSVNYGDVDQNGSHTITVLAGQTFTIAMQCIDNVEDVGELTISNFVFTPLGSTYNYAWSPALGLSSTNTQNTVASPTTTTTYTLTVTNTLGGCSGSDDVTVTVVPLNTASAASSTPTLCINTAMTNITHTTTSATGIGAATGLPAGVSASWAGNLITISGTPTASGTFNYSIPLTGGCGTVSATGTITVTPLNTVAAGQNRTVCVNSAMASISLATTGATGATVTGLPAGVTGSWAANVVTISGTPTASGTFTYTVTTTGGCPPATTTGTITVTPLNTVAAGTSQTVCINSAITTISLATTGATGATVTGLPAGVTGTWAANVVTISGTPTASGTFTYTVTTTGGCPPATTTGTITVTPLNTVAAGTSQTVCINSAITTISLATTGATGATVTGLPAGVTGTWAANVVTISGTPTASGTFTYTVTTTGGCPPATTTGTITVTPLNTVAAGTSQTVCINSAITTISLATTGATGATVTGLPAGVTGTWAANVVTISGTPTASGTFTYTVTTTGGCPPATTTGTITVTPLNTVAAGTSQTVCINSAITTISLATTGATGATVTGLPAGVTGTWAANVVTISGTPTASGTFTYTVTTTGGCPPATTTGTITVTPLNTVAAGTSQTVCINSAITTISLATTGATGATVTGLPAGVTGTWAANVVTISGTPTASGTFTYTVTTTGGCPPATTTGTITVTPLNTVAAGTSQTVCINSAITNITLATTGATGATVTGLPAGVTGTWAANVVTISGTPTASGTFTYTVTTTGGCPPATTTGTITVTPLNTVATGTSQTVCINSAITTISLATTGATGATVTGLPAGVTGTWAANVVTISGTPTASGTFTYTVTTTGGCPPATTTGTITVTATNTIAAGASLTSCINTAITTFTMATTGATGATFAGLPTGVTGSWAANVATISGTPTVSGTFNYTVTTTGGCPPATTSGTITINPIHTITAGANQDICINNAMTNITMTIGGGATGATVTGLPAGVVANVVGTTLTISGTPTASGVFNYSVVTTGNACITASTNGTLTVDNSSVAPTGVSGPTTICLGGGAPLTVVGGSLGTGANWQWFTGSCGGTLIGTGATITVQPTANTTYYVGASASGTGTCPATSCANTTVTLPAVGNTLSQNNELATCIVNQNNFIHFFHSSGRLLASINSNGQDLGNVTVTSYVAGAPIDVPACNTASASWITTTMGRHWMITPQFQPVGPVVVRLPFDDTPGGELDQLILQSASNLNITDNVMAVSDLKLSKYSGPSNVNSNPFDNCFGAGGNAGTTIHSQVANSTVGSYLAGFNTNARYVDFTINSFSEFWLHGSSGDSPLPVEISDAKVSCINQNELVNIQWTTQSETNSLKFEVEKTVDYANWIFVGSRDAAGNSSTEKHYSLNDEVTEYAVYYRLKQIDQDGTFEYFNLGSVHCDGVNTLTVYPNPTRGQVTLRYNSNEDIQGASIEIVDVYGKLISSKPTSILDGTNEFIIDLSNYADATYFIHLRTPEGVMKPVKIVKMN